MRTEAEWTFLNSLAHKYTLLLQLRERLGLPADTARDHLAGMQMSGRVYVGGAGVVCGGGGGSVGASP